MLAETRTDGFLVGGESFFAADERQKAWYQLSEVLTRLILDSPNASRFGEFVAAAERADGGEGAALSVLGYSLNHAVSKFWDQGGGWLQIGVYHSRTVRKHST